MDDEALPPRAYVCVAIEPREDGGVRLAAHGTGIVLSSADADAAFADLGAALGQFWKTVLSLEFAPTLETPRD